MFDGGNPMETPFYLFLFEIYLKGKTRSNPSCPGIEDSEVATLWPQGAGMSCPWEHHGTSPEFFGGQGSNVWVLHPTRLRLC
jgi:hypothetical protein